MRCGALRDFQSGSYILPPLAIKLQPEYCYPSVNLIQISVNLNVVEFIGCNFGLHDTLH
jgi:hypothetical protein